VTQAPHSPRQRHKTGQNHAHARVVSVNQPGQNSRDRQKYQRPVGHRTSPTFPSCDVAQSYNPRRQRQGCPQNFSGHTAFPDRCYRQKKKESAGCHQHRRKRHPLVDRIVENNRPGQQCRKNRSPPSLHCQPDDAGDYQRPSRLPHPLLGHRSRGYRSLPTKLSVEVRVEGVVKDHASYVNQTGREHHHAHSAQFKSSSQDPCSQTIGPHRWQIRCPGKN